jgi:hypothetical protein
MEIPKLKRVKVSTEAELRTWLAQNATLDQEVMIISCGKRSKDKHLSSATVRRVLQACGWASRGGYTLNGNLLGHVAARL